MTLSAAQFGSFRLFTIETGTFRLDGGSIFGVVPKTLWSQQVKCDERNRIQLTARSLLVHSTSTGRVYLIDTGVGHKFNEKMSKIYGLDFSGYTLQSSLEYHGFQASDITDVVLTHLHFDHCGGGVVSDADGTPSLAFPGAKYWVHKDQWKNALEPNVREAASYLPENIGPLEASGQIRLVDDGHRYEPDFTIEVVLGHTPGQQLPLLSAGGRKLLFAADLLPMTAHLPLPWVMGFDTRPLLTLEDKKRVFSRCIQENRLLYLEHDPQNELVTLGNSADRPNVTWTGTLNDL